MDKQHVDRYAEYLVSHAAGLRPDQRLMIRGRLSYRDFGLRVGRFGYEAGARQVLYHWFDPLGVEQLIEHGTPAQIALHGQDTEVLYDHALRTGAAVILLDGSHEPELPVRLARAHPRNYALFSRTMSGVNTTFQSRAVDHGLCPLVIAPVPTASWGERVFPELSGAEAADRLATEVFRVVGVDRPDVAEFALERDRALKARAAALDRLRIREIRVTGGGNDLRVGFSAKARSHGGRVRTASGQEYLPNVPILVVSSSPDRRRTEGVLVSSRPLRLRSGLEVRDLELEFRGGRLVDFRAGEGGEVFAGWIGSDEGSHWLGGFGLVGADSAVARSGLFFDWANLDLNAASYVVLGVGFAVCLADGGSMSPRELEAEGLNRSELHVAVPFGSPEVRIRATDSREGEVTLLEKGAWTERFAEA